MILNTFPLIRISTFQQAYSSSAIQSRLGSVCNSSADPLTPPPLLICDASFINRLETSSDNSLKEKSISPVQKEDDLGRLSVTTVIEEIAECQFQPIQNEASLSNTPSLIEHRFTTTPRARFSESRDCNSTETTALYEDLDDEKSSPVVKEDLPERETKVTFADSCTLILIPTRKEYLAAVVDPLELSDQELASIPTCIKTISISHLLWMHSSEYRSFIQNGNEQILSTKTTLLKRIDASITPFSLALKCLQRRNPEAFEQKTMQLARKEAYKTSISLEDLPPLTKKQRVVTFIEEPSVIRILSRKECMEAGFGEVLWGEEVVFNYPGAKKLLDYYWNYYLDIYVEPFLGKALPENLIERIRYCVDVLRDMAWQSITGR